MANSYMDQSAGTSVQRDYKVWVMSLLASSALLVILGVWLAGITDGVPRLWTGLAFVIAMGLALVVGASKTSSA